MSELTEDEMKGVISSAIQYILPIAQKYKLTGIEANTALSEAFQAGIKFAVDNFMKGEK